MSLYRFLASRSARSRQFQIRASQSALAKDIALNVVIDEFKNHAEWEEYYITIIESQQEKAGNAGQETLLGDDYFIPVANDYCAQTGRSYDANEFVDYVKDVLGDDYYNAINEIIDECSQELQEAHNYLFNFNLFSSAFTAGRLFGSNRQALQSYSANATRNYGRNWNNYAASAGRSSAFATRFLAGNRNGISRVTPSTPYAGRNYEESAAASSRAAANFLSRFPNGRSRVTPSSPFANTTYSQSAAASRKAATTFLSKYPRGTKRTTF